ncbi:MAG: hypothetical protein JWN10_2282 [Solirubrobacterales bacterium]|nr:hypothetical protein [Solirubrobacterales bacterium]
MWDMAASEHNGQIGEHVVQDVLDALADQDYDFRTVRGIGEQLSLSPEAVQEALNRIPERVRASAVPGPDGERLYAPSGRPVTARERLALAQTVVEKTVS